MEQFTHVIVTHGYLLLASWVFLDQLGIPIPGVPVLIAAGALVGTGQLHPAATLAAATLGSIPGDLLWFELGRRRGGSVLRLLCKLSLEPDSCVRSTQNSFARHGPRSLLVAKFVPGYQTMAPPLAGMSVGRFLAWSVPGAALWSGAFMGLGFIFADQIDDAYRVASELGTQLLVLLALGLVSYVGWKYLQRVRFIRQLRTMRIEPHELHELLAAEEPVSVFDLRDGLAIEVDPRRIPGARLLNLDELDVRHAEIPRDREIVLYCT
jgi:membrane protein DedA with SNARE-associated domain